MPKTKHDAAWVEAEKAAARRDMARVQADKVLARRLAEEERFSRAERLQSTEVRIHTNKWTEVPEEYTDESANSARMRMIVKQNNKDKGEKE